MPWITRKPSHSSYVRPSVFFFSLASFFITSLHRRISPSLSLKGKERTLVALSFCLYFLFISFDFSGVMKATEREYFFPRMSFLIFWYITLSCLTCGAFLFPSFGLCVG